MRRKTHYHLDLSNRGKISKTSKSNSPNITASVYNLCLSTVLELEPIVLQTHIVFRTHAGPQEPHIEFFFRKSP